MNHASRRLGRDARASHAIHVPEIYSLHLLYVYSNSIRNSLVQYSSATLATARWTNGQTDDRPGQLQSWGTFLDQDSACDLANLRSNI